MAKRDVAFFANIVCGCHLADRKPGEIFGGQSQGVSIAHALAPDSKLIVPDEAVS